MIYICLQCLLSILVGAAQSRVGVALVFLHLLSVCLILFCISYLTLTMWSCHNNFFSIFCCVWYRSVFHLAVGFTASRGRLLVYMICMRMIWVITGAQLDIKYFKWTFRSIFHINILAPGRLLVGHSLYMHRAFQPGALGNWPPSKGASGTSPKALIFLFCT